MFSMQTSTTIVTPLDLAFLSLAPSPPNLVSIELGKGGEGEGLEESQEYRVTFLIDVVKGKSPRYLLRYYRD